MNRRLTAAIFLGLMLAPCMHGYETYTLYNTTSSTTSRLIDYNLNLVKTWTFTRPPSASMPYLVQPDSTIFRAQTVSHPSMMGGGFGGNIQKMSWSGTILWNYTAYGTNYQQHHDIEPMPNGNVLFIAWERKTNTEARAMGRVSITGEMWPDMVIEVNPTNNTVVWEWHFWDHMIQDVDAGKPNYGVVRDHPELLDINFGPVFGGDWMHCNAVDYNAELDQIILSSHNLSEIYIVDHSTTTAEARGHTGGRSGMGGDLLYRWGNPQAYDRGTSANQRFYVVHGVNWIRPGLPGAGNVLLFNNGDRSGITGDSSSVEEIVTPRTGYTYYIHPDSAFGPLQPIWVYSAGTSFYSNHLAGAFRLSNGNTFICEATRSRLLEVNPANQIVWSFSTGSEVANAKRYDFSMTGVKEEAMSNEQRAMSLRIEPNPCRNKTVMRWTRDVGRNRSEPSGSQRQEARLRIYDVSGRVVKSFPITNKQLPVTIRWNVCDPQGAALPAGVYFVNLSVSNGSARLTETKTLIVTGQ